MQLPTTCGSTPTVRRRRVTCPNPPERGDTTGHAAMRPCLDRAQLEETRMFSGWAAVKEPFRAVLRGRRQRSVIRWWHRGKARGVGAGRAAAHRGGVLQGRCHRVCSRSTMMQASVMQASGWECSHVVHHGPRFVQVLVWCVGFECLARRRPACCTTASRGRGGCGRPTRPNPRPPPAAAGGASWCAANGY